jgi:hypothetical protein
VVPLQNTAAVQQSEAHKHNEGAGEGLMVAGMSFALFCKAIMYMALLAYRSLDPAVPTTYKVSLAEGAVSGCYLTWLVGWLLVGCWLVAGWLVVGWLMMVDSNSQTTSPPTSEPTSNQPPTNPANQPAVFCLPTNRTLPSTWSATSR